LLQRLADGDQAAFTQLYEQVAGHVYGLANRILRCPSQAEEVAQEVLLEVWQTAARYDASRGPGRAWIMTMAHRRAVDRVRGEQAARERDDRDGLRAVGAHSTWSRRRSNSVWSINRSVTRSTG
jgi:RNA polymerase sigma-70 factor (ECF subfamily)